MSFGFSGGFWPMGLPLFHASRFSMTAMIDSLVINRSLIFRFGEKRLLSEIMLYACCRPIADIRSEAIRLVVSCFQSTAEHRFYCGG